MKGYWIALYKRINNSDNLKKYGDIVTPIIKSFGGVPIVRGGKHKTFEGDDFVRTVVWEFPNYEKAIEYFNIKENDDVYFFEDTPENLEMAKKIILEAEMIMKTKMSNYNPILLKNLLVRIFKIANSTS